MIARASQLHLPTLREDPADAEAVSHKLLVRGGFVRQVSAGLWTFMPLGWRVHRKVEQIIREEMDAIGSQEMYAPVLTPAELWQRSDRYGIPELFKLKDRTGRDYVLPITHEETFTLHAAELQSYKQLPQLWYHLQTKDRDEPRPSGGLIRVREFVMKDSYSFDLDEAGLDKSFELNRAAYVKIFERCGVATFMVLAESGIMGGTESYDFLAPAGSGGNTLVTCENGDYAADLEIAHGIPRAPDLPPPLDAPEAIETPDATTIEALAKLLAVDEAATSKAMPHTKSDGTVILALVRGDDRLEEAKLLAAVGADVRPSTEAEIKAAFGADPGSLGPVGFKGEVIADETLREGQFVVGANRTGWHLKGVEEGRDYEARFADLRVPKEGDRCPLCGGALQFQTAIEVGHIFKLGTKFSEPFGATVLDEDGNERLLVMGSYGIGIERILSAAIELYHDKDGMSLPASIAPFQVVITPVNTMDAAQKEAANQIYKGLLAAGIDALLDDRDERPGVKFKDADLIGIPYRVTLGKKLASGVSEVVDRRAKQTTDVPLDQVITYLRERL